MLHIILGILKAAGIVIGLLLCIFFCLVFSLLFVPVRYRAGIVRQKEKQQLNIGLSWLLRLVSVAVSGGQNEGMTVSIRLFGFRLPVFGKEKQPKKRRKKKDSKVQQKQKKKTKKSNTKEVRQTAERISSKKTKPAEKTEKTRPKPSRETEKPGPAPKTGKISQAAAALKEKIRNFRKKLLELRQKPARIKKSFEGMREKISAFFRTIEEYEIKEIAGNLQKEARYLLKHYKPRRIRGYLRFGAGDPAMTGIMTGFVYLFLPARADQFSVMPDFHETVFETEMIFTGYLRSVHLIRTVFHLFRDKKLRRVFKGADPQPERKENKNG